MIQDLNISQGLRNLAVGLLGTTLTLTAGLPQQAQAATLGTGVYAYAYQQITNLKISGLSTAPFEPNTSAGSSLLTFNPTPTGQISNQFDVNESFVSSSQTSGANLGIGNNTGFFSGNPIPDSDKGQVNADYGRGDAVLSSSNTTPVPITSSGQLQTLLFGMGVNGAGVAESYLDQPATTLFQTIPRDYYKDEGNGNGEWTISSNPFSLVSDTSIQFNYDYLNKLIVQIDPTTPLGASETNQARAQVGFEMQINWRSSLNGSSRPVFRHNPAVTNKSVSLNSPGRTESLLDMGSQQASASLLQDRDGDGTPDTYTIVILGRNLVNTRLVEVPEPLTILGAATAAGFGAFFKRTLNRKRKQDQDRDNT
jgi:hypothetical protein